MHVDVDDALRCVVNRRATAGLGALAFDHPFYRTLTLAVGGGCDRDPASDAVVPATMRVESARAFVRAR